MREIVIKASINQAFNSFFFTLFSFFMRLSQT
uniref:Uncharacterized protein n=1 Tax=Rhizophora mucronata TaxID=61149 RepID=A0A2P2QF35_RHIMU